MDKILCSFFEYLLNNWIAISALIISSITLNRNKIKLDVDIEKNARWILAIRLDDGSSIINENGMLIVNIKVINPSNFDIGYFDLNVVDTKNNSELHPYQGSQFSTLNNINSNKASSYFGIDQNSYSLDLPTSNYGILKARSLTSIDIVVSPESEISEIYVLFKITKRKPLFKKSKHGFINSPYEQYASLIQVEQSSKPDYGPLLALLHT